MQPILCVDTEEFIAISKGDKNAFERLFRKYYQPLCEYGRGILGDGEQAEDVVQNTFIYLWNNRQIIDIHSSVKSYLYSSVRHGALNVLNKQILERKHSSQLAEFIEFLHHSDYSEEEEEEVKRIRSVMAELPKQCLKVFLMSVLDQKKYQEIADELNISINTVKTHITKAYRLIREKKAGNMRLLLLIFSTGVD